MDIGCYLELQWSRSLIRGGNRPHSLRSAPRPVRASMEPLPFRERKPRGDAADGKKRSSRFNGAAPFRERKGWVSRLTDACAASMEPLPFESGRIAHDFLRSVVSVCDRFNGAAPFRERKGGRAWLADDDAAAASMEPPLSRAEMAERASHNLVSPAPCFNGAAPFRERKDPQRRLPSVTHAVASMEPLPFESGRTHLLRRRR